MTIVKMVDIASVVIIIITVVVDINITTIATTRKWKQF
jgi:hypothetical protein